MSFYIGAYGISPSATQQDPDRESAFIEGLKALPFVRGLELPHYASTLDRWDEDFFFARADPAWDYVVTTLPALFAALREQPRFGLASTDDAGREAALAGIEAARTSVRRTHDRLGRQAVRAVEVHSGPSRGWLDGTGSKERFADSLARIASADWDGAEIVVEHCDAAVVGQPHEKGFLRIADEIAAIGAANARGHRIGASINWGRSGIELRGGERVHEHVRQLAEAGLLRGLIFSGCSGADTPFGAWKDTHMPPVRERYVTAGADGSLLDERAMIDSLRAAGDADLAFLGIKIAARPVDTPVPQRLELLRSALTMLAAARLSLA